MRFLQSPTLSQARIRAGSFSSRRAVSASIPRALFGIRDVVSSLVWSELCTLMQDSVNHIPITLEL